MNFVDDWRHFGRPSGVWILKDDTLLVADSESSPAGYRPLHELVTYSSRTITLRRGAEPVPRHPGWQPGIRIGSAKDGSLKYFITGTRPEGMGADQLGNVYGGLTGGCDTSPSGGCLQKFVKK